jgi:uncharacterized protein (TIGR03083 family)
MHNHHDDIDNVAMQAINAAEHEPLVDDHLDTCDACNKERRHMLEALPLSIDEIDPPFDLRTRVLQAASHLRQPTSHETTPQATSADAYWRAVETLDALLDDLDDNQWNVQATTQWTVREVVVHLRAVDEIAADALTGNPSHHDVTHRTKQELATPETTAVTRHRWFKQARALIDIAQNTNADTVGYLGIQLAAVAVVADRAFETWLHTQDIRLALGRALLAPTPADLSVLTNLGAHMLGKVVRDQPHQQKGNVRLVLDGSGGGNWMVPLRPQDTTIAPTATLTVDAVDFCLLLGDRLLIDDLQFHIDGDEDAAKVLLTSAPLLARA